MTHTVSSPPPDTGGGSFSVSGNGAKATFSWNPPHNMPPKVERRRTERAEVLRLQLEELLNAPMGEEGHVE